MLKEYYSLTKPGIVYGNALTAAAGYFIGAGGIISLHAFFFMLAGISFIVASGCVFNNYIDRDIDAKMARTKNRALVRGTIPLRSALIFGTLLTLVGAIFLYGASLLALVVALFGLFAYTVVYSLWCKRSTLHATVIGSISGAVPPVVGYAAATNSLDVAALILFLILFTWQMPHALAIAIRRFDDYRAADIPVLPIQLGLRATKTQMSVYAAAFVLASAALSLVGYASLSFLGAMVFLGTAWTIVCILGFWTKNDRLWAKQVFLFSLIIILAFCALAALNSLLP